MSAVQLILAIPTSFYYQTFDTDRAGLSALYVRAVWQAIDT